MNKKRIIIGSIAVFSLSALFHSVYTKFPNVFTSLFFPVNESIWEHNKLILLSFFVWTIIEKIFFKAEKSITITNLITCILCIVLVDLIFTPIYLYVLNTNDNMIVTLVIYGLSILSSFILSEKINLRYDEKTENISLIGFAMLSLFFIFLTFNPPKMAIFYDYNGEFYGLKEK